MAGIDSPFMIRRTEGGKRVEQTFKKYEKMTTHTARRSFATNLYKEIKNLNFVSKILGHSKLEQTVKYLKLSAEENAQLVAV